MHALAFNGSQRRKWIYANEDAQAVYKFAFVIPMVIAAIIAPMRIDDISENVSERDD